MSCKQSRSIEEYPMERNISKLRYWEGAHMGKDVLWKLVVYKSRQVRVGVTSKKITKITT